VAHVSRIRKKGVVETRTVHPDGKVDCTVVVNKMSVKASISKLSDGLDALVWLIKKAGGSLHYRDALMEVRNPHKFGRWLTERMRHLQHEREVKKHG